MATTPPIEATSIQTAIREAVRRHKGLFLFEGIALTVLGVTAMLVPVLASFAATLFFGWIFLVSGVVGLFTTYHGRRVPGFWWSLLSALVGIAAGSAAPGVAGARSALPYFSFDRRPLGRRRNHYLVCARTSHRSGTLGLPPGERYRRPDVGNHAVFRPTEYGHLGPRTAARHQHVLRRLGLDSHGPFRSGGKHCRHHALSAQSQPSFPLPSGVRGDTAHS